MTGVGLLGAELEVLRPLERKLLLRLTLLALETEDDLTGSLGLLVEDGLRLSTETHLLRVVTALPLGEVRGLTGLVLRDLVDLVVAALARGAVGLPFLGDVDHLGKFELREEGDSERRGTKLTLYLWSFHNYPAARVLGWSRPCGGAAFDVRPWGGVETPGPWVGVVVSTSSSRTSEAAKSMLRPRLWQR